MKKYLPRVIDAKIADHLSVFGAVLVQGPKWCGKSTTSLQHSESQIYLSDPRGNFQNKRLAIEDPSLVLDGKRPRLIDEWQDVPPIWDAVKFAVDKEQQHGAYILTGSSVPPRWQTFHSGIGRISKINMFPMSLWESGDSSGTVSFRDLFSSKKLSSENPLNLTGIAELTVRGGWPGNLSLAKSKQAILPLSYIDSIADDDISRYDGVERSPTITRDIIKAIARNNQTLVTNKTLIKDASNISEPTFTSYFDVLQKLFVVDNIPAWAPNLRSPMRLRTSPKVRLVDPSLAVAALGMTADKLIGDLETFGFMFENLCSRDIKAFAENMDARLFHYRENAAPGKKEHEIDLIVELADGEWGGFEIKLGASQIEDAEQNLLGISERLQRNGARPPKCLAVISGLSHYAYTTKNGVNVVPIGCLMP